ncbi:FecR family protein [Kordiimonas pumila]|uniref:FecR family protein n=1 Tax=Kordiimonas pumila TaxID=2161677 RepID=A0ABV7D5D7_9PROT|nr:FecR domain-containing protein [Kordiimonas pumila]
MTDKSNIVPLPDLGSEASGWLVLIDDGEMTPEDWTEFKAWFAKSDKHQEAFRQRASLWSDFDGLKALNDYAQSNEIKNLLAKDAKSHHKTHLYARRGFLTGIAASLALITGSGVAFKVYNDQRKVQLQSFQTELGGQRTIDLKDGSVITLNTSSEIKVEYRAGKRCVYLLCGEAYFDVAHDPSRPFFVIVGKKAVRALGTSFSVRLLEKKVHVTVSEGRVALLKDITFVEDGDAMPIGQPLAEVSYGQNVLFENDIELMEKLPPRVLAKKLAWRDGVLAFSGEPLSKVVEEVERYTGMNIEFENDIYASMPISGYVKIGQYSEMFEALEIMADLKAVHLSSNRVKLVKLEKGDIGEKI